MCAGRCLVGRGLISRGPGATWEGGRGDLLCDVGDATLWKMRNSRLKEEKAAVI